LNLLRCDGRIPQRSRMNLLARLLLEISIALFFRLLAREESLSTLRKQSGKFARMEGVVSGSRMR
jgi:hypothetical protein